MFMSRLVQFLSFYWIILPSLSSAFVTIGSKQDVTATAAAKSALFMAPRFDKSSQKWIGSEQDYEGGYGPMGSLIRQGPVPFFKRVTDPELYDQMVLKYQAGDGVGRKEAQGNMDAFLANPNDWLFQKNAEKKGAAKYDYANANTDPQQVILTSIWAAIVFSFIGRVIYVYFDTKGALVNENLSAISDAVTSAL